MSAFGWIRLFLVCSLLKLLTQGAYGQQRARNPVIWADVPDPSVIRVGDTYYMSSTTMHMNPGVPIMKSNNLVNWRIVNYVYSILADNDVLSLSNGQQTYGRGTWASSLRYHKGMFYLATFSASTGKTHVFSTPDIEKGTWTESAFEPALHDLSLVFEDSGRVYMIYGNDEIRLIELTSDASAIKPDGFHDVIIANASKVAGPNIMLGAEGSQVYKFNGNYYIFLITWPRNGIRTQLVYRSESLMGPYEGKVVLRDRGIAQGGVVRALNGEWYGFLFRDYGAVGRVPYLVPMAWEDGWPVFGKAGSVPDTLDVWVEHQNLQGIVTSDEFNREEGDPLLPLEWQWNHNPDSTCWSITERPGYLRIKTGRRDTSILNARNTLTQRTFGPVSSGKVGLDISQMKEGDVAGLAAFQKNYGYVGINYQDGRKLIVMVNAADGSPEEVASVPLEQERVYLKISMDFRDQTDQAHFAYSLDGESWEKIGDTLQMSYTLPHFMGYRFALFNYATETTGGYVDFDWFRTEASDYSE